MATTAPASASHSPEQRQQLIAAARAGLSPEALGTLCYEMTAIASPTGEELTLAGFVADRLRSAGANVKVHRTGERGASVSARVGGRGDGPRTWVYAPLDTAFSGNHEEDRPFLGASPRADFALPPSRADGKVIGLGAENPKGFAAAGLAAVEAISRQHPDLPGEIVLTLCGGSMPVNSRPGFGSGVGHGVGVRQLLAELPTPEFAISLKPGYAVSWEEVGYAWFRITVRGGVNYTGIRHKAPYKNPVLAASRMTQRLEAWFAEYSAQNSAGLVAPQGSINAVLGGSPDRTAFIPSTAEVHLDLRVGPDSSPDDAQRQLEAALGRIREEDPDLDFELERTAELPGTRTDPETWIVRSLIAAWERFEGKPHEPMGRQSGASDAAVLRSAGIPTARIGLPAPQTSSPFTGFSMGVADEASMCRLALFLIDPLIETASRSRAETGVS